MHAASSIITIIASYLATRLAAGRLAIDYSRLKVTMMVEILQRRACMQPALFYFFSFLGRHENEACETAVRGINMKN
jgi:hypothetical protein